MRLHRFFVQAPLVTGGEASISDKELLHQWKKVFRLGKGDRCILLDDSGFEYEAEFGLLSRDEALLHVLSSRSVGNAPRREVVMFLSIIKKDHFELVLEKGTELGVSRFVPVLSERSEKKGLNMERARKIIREASEQSGRGKLPELSDIIGLEDVRSPAGGKLVAFHPEGEAFDGSDFPAGDPVGAIIGPEGGWSERETAFFKESGIETCSLGRQVLRAETAAIAVPALLLL